MTKDDGARTSKYWRDRADEAHAHATEMVSEDGKAWMLEIARLYSRLADKAAKGEAKTEGRVTARR
jgi:hypothetical protein